MKCKYYLLLLLGAEAASSQISDQREDNILTQKVTATEVTNMHP